MSAAPGTRLRGAWGTGVVLALLALHACAALWSATRESAVYDEVAHIGAGYAHLAERDFRYIPVAAPLMKLIAGSLVVGRSHTTIPPAAREVANGWQVGYTLLYGGDAVPGQLLRARLPFIALSVVLGLVLYGWGRELWGTAGGVLTALFHAASSEMLAHAHYATLDLGMALATTLLLWGAWRFVARPTLAHGVWVASAAAFALVTKYSAPALGLMCVLSAAPLIVARWRSDRVGRAVFVVRLVLVLEGALVLGLALVWACFGFRQASAPGGPYVMSSALEALLPIGSGLRAVLQALLARGIIPEGFADGIAATAFVPSNHQMAFLAGRIADGGWWYYFPAALVLKTPIPLLVLAVLAVFLARPRASSSESVPEALPDARGGAAVPGRHVVPGLLLGVAAYLAIAMSFRVSVGYRHVLPVLPLLFLLAGGAASGLLTGGIGRRRGRVVAVLLLAWYVLGTVRVAPHFLSYFNELAGGPEGGSRYLLDSNVDWGQDLDELGRWVRREGVSHLKLSYFGTASPEAAGVPCDALPSVTCCWSGQHAADSIEAGDVVAVSVTNLRGVYFRVPGAAPMPVRVRLEGEPERVLPFVEAMRLLDERYVPAARAGYSIWIYRLLPQYRRAG